MAGVKGRSGRTAGTPNKVTRDVREAIAVFAQDNVENMTTWLNQIEDPAKRLDLYLRALEYHVPKLARTELTGANGGPMNFLNVTPQERDAEIKRLLGAGYKPSE
jgi:hypothetical protein